METTTIEGGEHLIFMDVLLPLWKKHKLKMFNPHIDKDSPGVLMFSLKGTKDDIFLYENDFSDNRSYYNSAIQDLVCSKSIDKDVVSEIAKQDKLKDIVYLHTT